jgi:hypothetical protein
MLLRAVRKSRNGLFSVIYGGRGYSAAIRGASMKPPDWRRHNVA